MTQFVQIIFETFKKHIVISRCWFFVNDINVTNSCSNYDEKETLSEIRLFRIYYEAYLMTKCNVYELKKDWLHDIKWKILILYI